jgi:hypothetical protein
MRPSFQHDRDRFMHAKAFRRPAGGPRVFLALEGDHDRTRITHTLEVAQIARTVARALRLNEVLAQTWETQEQRSWWGDRETGGGCWSCSQQRLIPDNGHCTNELVAERRRT